MSKTKKIIFCCRHENDLDHIAPIIYNWNSTNSEIPFILFVSRGSFLIEESSLYQLLLDEGGVNLKHITSASRLLSFLYKFRQLLEVVSKNIPTLILRTFYFFLAPRLDNLLNKLSEKVPSDFILTQLLEFDRGIIIFDQVYNCPLANRIRELSKSKPIISVCIPHALFINKCKILIDKPDDFIEKTNPMLVYLSKTFHYNIVNNSFLKERFLSMGLQESQIKILGSARFSPEWIEQLTNCYSKKNSIPFPSKKLRILLVLSKFKYGLWEEEIENIIRIISQFPESYIIIKPHTRGMCWKKVFPANVLIDSSKTPTTSLIEWSNIVMFMSTSVIHEAILKDKIILYLCYVFTGKIYLEDFFPNATITSRFDLLAAIWNFYTDENFKTYSYKQKQKYLLQFFPGIREDITMQNVRFYQDILSELALDKA